MKLLDISKLKFNRYTVLLSLGVLGNMALWWLWSRFPQGAAPLVLRYQVGGGIDVLGERSLLATIPLIGLLALFVNGALTVLLHRRDSTLATLVAAVAVSMQVLLVVALLILFAKNIA